MSTFMKPVTPKLLFTVFNVLACLFGLVALSLMLGGCTGTSPAIPNIYLVQISTTATNSALVRIGYLGLCTNTITGFKCASKVNDFGLQEQASAAANLLMDTGKKLANRVFPVTLEAIAAGLYVMAAISMTWQLLSVKQGRKVVIFTCLFFVASSIAQTFAITAFWYASNAVIYSSSESVVIKRGMLLFWSHLFMIIYPLFLISTGFGSWISKLMKDFRKGKGKKPTAG